MKAESARHRGGASRDPLAIREMPETMRQLASSSSSPGSVSSACGCSSASPSRGTCSAPRIRSSPLYTRGRRVGRATASRSIRSSVSRSRSRCRRSRDAIGRKTTHASACCAARGTAVGLGHPRAVAAPAVDGRRRDRVGLNPVDALRHPRGRAAAGSMGVYMGVFNFFIVLPEIVAAIGVQAARLEGLPQRSGPRRHLGRGLFARRRGFRDLRSRAGEVG